MASPTRAHQQLALFEGTWRTQGTIVATAEAPATPFSGTDTYTWLPGGFFMLHQVNVMMGNERNQTTEVMGYDTATGRYTLHYFDNQGGQGVMYGTLHGRVWTITGDTLRFTGRFDEAGKTLTGTWERTENGKDWMVFLTIGLTKV